jgi:tRNA-splicing ligase RtcB
MFMFNEEGKAQVRLWIPPEEIEASALEQIRFTASLPWVTGVAVMPDVHAGKGATIGTVVAMKDAIAPSAVGVDIGCGMIAKLTNLTARDVPKAVLGDLRAEIERQIPVGTASYDEAPSLVRADDALWTDFTRIVHDAQVKREVALRQCGTLGSGNHFIEVCLDEKNRVWLMLHSGSRNIGKTIADIYIAMTKSMKHNAGLGDLGVLLKGTPEFQAYWHDLQWAQRYAWTNREVMMVHSTIALERILKREVTTLSIVQCHHNYVTLEPTFHSDADEYVTRKGAIRVPYGTMGIIPGSMGTRSYIVIGNGMPTAYNSASHGAGRRMTRGAARRQYTADDLAKQTEGVECRKDNGIVDEIPASYKDIDRVMENQKELVSVHATLKAILCVKG